MSFRFTEEDCEILESLFHRDDSGGYAVRVPGGQWFGAWKFKMVTEFAEAGAKLYHKLRDGLEEELAAHKARARRNVYQEITVTLTPSDVDEETYTVGSIGKSRLRDVSTDHHMDWGRLAKEGASQIRTRTPPPLLYIKGHAKFEGQKLANVPSARRVSTPKDAAAGVSKEVVGELLRSVAYFAEREELGTVDYTMLEADMLKPMANKSALQELGRDILSYIERTAEKIINKNSNTDNTINSS